MSLLAQYDASWPQQFQRAAEELRQLIGASVVAIHHVGSTAVATIAWSKPVIDILVEVRDLSDLDGCVAERLREYGFEERAEYGIARVERMAVAAASENPASKWRRREAL